MLSNPHELFGSQLIRARLQRLGDCAFERLAKDSSHQPCYTHLFSFVPFVFALLSVTGCPKQTDGLHL